MVTTQAIALAAAGLVMGVRDYCCWGEECLPYDAQGEAATLLSVWGLGARQLHAEVAQYALLVAELEALLWSELDKGFPGVWHYEVVEALGWSITEWIVRHDGVPPNREWVTHTLLQLAGKFFSRAPRENKPALRRVLKRYAPTVSPKRFLT